MLDIVNAYYLLMMTDKSDGKVFNVSGDNPHEMGVYTDMLLAHSKLEGVVKEISPKLFRPIDIYYQHGDCQELVDITGWKPNYTLEQTIRDLLDYWVKKIS